MYGEHVSWYFYPDLATEPDIQWPPTPLWPGPNYSIHLRIPGLRRKGSPPDTVIRCLVESHRKQAYGDFRRVYSDGSVKRGSHSATAAFVVPSIGHAWRIRQGCSTSSTIVVLVAIAEAVVFLVKTSSRRSVILCEPRCARKRLGRTVQMEATSTCVRLSSYKLTDLGHTIILQWIPGYSGIPGNVRADSVA